MFMHELNSKITSSMYIMSDNKVHKLATVHLLWQYCIEYHTALMTSFDMKNYKKDLNTLLGNHHLAS